MKDGLDTKNKIIAPKCDTDEPSDVDMADEKPDAKSMTKGKYQSKSTVVRFEEPPKKEKEMKEEEDKESSPQAKLDSLKSSDEVSEIYKVYWSRKHDQIVAKIKVKRAEKKGDLGRNRQYADILTKIPVRQLRDKKASLFIDFMSELIKDEIKRQKERTMKNGGGR